MEAVGVAVGSSERSQLRRQAATMAGVILGSSRRTQVRPHMAHMAGVTRGSSQRPQLRPQAATATNGAAQGIGTDSLQLRGPDLDRARQQPQFRPPAQQAEGLQPAATSTKRAIRVLAKRNQRPAEAGCPRRLRPPALGVVQALWKRPQLRSESRFRWARIFSSGAGHPAANLAATSSTTKRSRPFERLVRLANFQIRSHFRTWFW